MKIISGSSNVPLATALSQQLSLELVEVELSTFANGEKRVWIKDSVKNDNIILVQSFSNPADEHLIEFLLLVDALQRGGARHINVIIPWMGYSLQDKMFREGEPIAAKVVADLVSQTYVKRVFLLDLHNSSTPGFFSIPTQHINALTLFSTYLAENFDLSQCVIGSPDFGGLKRARMLAEKLELELVNIDKHRDLKSGNVTAVGVHGEIEGKIVILFDDVINTGSTVVETAQLLKENGATEVHFMATHGIFANDALAVIENSQVDSVLITDSIYHADLPSKIKTISVAELISEAVAVWA
ncbi:MAG: ribose-phosphate pyrophosphokinase [bacterium]|nr:ribose-phosphate pyrophosphokinase [bacterium]